MKNVSFTKMHSLGNDFVVINAVSHVISADDIPIQQWAHRHTGIGFDQLLLVKSSKLADFACQIFNGDGSEAEQCGNGMRCMARFIREEKLSDKSEITLETKAGIIRVTMSDFDQIQVNMGQPAFEGVHEVSLQGQTFQIASVSMGNPHAILQVSDVKNFPVHVWGALLSNHELFPNKANVGFMEIVNRQHIRLRTFERGAGETLACGSNSCAAVVAGIHKKLLDSEVEVELALGKLKIAWAGKNTDVILIGNAEKLFMGQLFFPCKE